jgi:hypothetical protein
MSDRIVSMSSSIGEWLLPGYSLNLAPRDPQCHVAGRFNTSAWITGAIHYQTERLNRWKNRADIDLAVHNLRRAPPTGLLPRACNDPVLR